MNDFTGRVALVTGAARGQGRAHAVALAERGADVVICDRCEDVPAVVYPMGRKDELAETKALVEATGRRCIAEQADTADQAAVQALVARAESEFGRIDIAIANAGVSAGAPIQEAFDGHWAEVIGTNLTGVFHTVAAVAPGMIARGYGRIITISSMLGRGAAPGQAAYCASKWGVVGMTKSVALDLAPHGVTANVIAPGNIATPMAQNDALYRKMRPDLESPTLADAEPVFATLHAQPVPFLEPFEVTRAVLYLADEASAHITGTVMPVDAGAAARVTA